MSDIVAPKPFASPSRRRGSLAAALAIAALPLLLMLAFRPTGLISERREENV